MIAEVLTPDSIPVELAVPPYTAKLFMPLIIAELAAVFAAVVERLVPLTVPDVAVVEVVTESFAPGDVVPIPTLPAK